jgi:hypothetical protein
LLQMTGRGLVALGCLFEHDSERPNDGKVCILRAARRSLEHYCTHQQGLLTMWSKKDGMGILNKMHTVVVHVVVSTTLQVGNRE